jgi:outer membrane protein
MRGFAAGLCAAVIALAGAPAVQAKDQGDLLVRLRGLYVIPDEGGHLDLGATRIAGRPSIRNQVVPEADFTYFLTPNFAAELILATTPHRVSAKGTPLGDVDLGKVWLLPPTLTLQYHLAPKARVSPYVGAGVNYTVFYNAKPGAANHVGYKDGFGWALQAGCDVALTDRWSFNVDVKKVFIDSRVTVDAGLPATIRSKVRINPWLVGVGVGYRF